MKMPKQLQALQTVLSHLSKREKVILYAVISIVSLAVLDRLIIYPISFKIKSLEDEIKDKESRIKTDLHILSQKDRILADSSKYGSFLASSKSEEEETTSLLKEIEDMANKSAIYLVDMKPAGLKNIGRAKKFMVGLNCEAQMEQLVDFMYNVENSNKLLTIEKYDISPKSRESSVAKCNIAISKIVMP